ncbi:large ribosomal subunit protein uL30m isoform X2 [Phymastichus coffea]|uniref:large ribosomal subunit protein uL30m isoform X2 n=1 Tax=Phymastichus coffea TaxID=108790 RepID=UPI00273CDF4A|nr:large ribosomal subunit protein uL30m isoform X2 [Phymastichus coffea]
MSSNFLLNTVKIVKNQVRTYYHYSTPKHWAKDGVKYGLITYYPRHPDHKDPEFKPSKLFLVERVKPTRGNPYWHKKVLKQLSIDQDYRMREKPTVIVKNTPEICALLWEIKHLIKVTPIDMPNNLPDDIDSISTYLHETGKLYVFPKIDEKRYKETEKHQNNPKRMDNDTISKHLRLKWLNGGDINI